MDEAFWGTVPTDRVVRLRGATPESIEMAIESSEDAPAILSFSTQALLRMPDLVRDMLAELDCAARGMVGQWLPEASSFGTSSAGLAAVRAVALRRAHDLGVPGTVLADLAVRAVTKSEPSRVQSNAEAWAEALGKVIASATGRKRVAVLMRARQELPAAALDQVIAAAQWLAHHGDIGVWLAGDGWQAVRYVAVVDVPIGNDVQDVEGGDEELSAVYPAVRGAPRWNSPAEHALEAALTDKPWAVGRCWNETYQSHPLANPISIDLLWRNERCAVEIDGPEHRLAPRFEADRRRDVQLQLDGFAVLRFTNAQIDHDIGAVVSQIKEFLTTRRELEGHHERRP